MKTSHHTYEKGKGFIIKEVYFEIVSYFVTMAFEEKGLDTKPEWYTSLYEDFLDISKGHVQGYAYTLVEKHLEFIEERESKIIAVLEEAKLLVQSKGEYLTPKELNQIEKEKKDWEGTATEWIGNLYTEDLIHVLDILIKMLKHEWQEKDYKVEFPKR